MHFLFNFEINDKVFRMDKIDVNTRPVPYRVKERYIVNNKIYYTIIRRKNDIIQVETAKEEDLRLAPVDENNYILPLKIPIKEAVDWILVDQYVPNNSDVVIVTIWEKDDDDQFCYRTAAGRYWNSGWIVNNRECDNVVAWQRLPDPFSR